MTNVQQLSLMVCIWLKMVLAFQWELWRCTSSLSVQSQYSSRHTKCTFHCAQYNCASSLKAMKRKLRASSKYQRIVEHNGHVPTLPFKDFVNNSQNKARLLEIICVPWSNAREHENIKLLLSGGFSDKITSLPVDQGVSHNVEELKSNHEEANNRVILHSL